METQLLADFADAIKKRLEDLDGTAEIAIDNAATVILDQQSVGRLSRMDALQQQAMAVATRKRRAAERKGLIAALTRIEDGSFGECEDCGEEIAHARLRLNPALRLCIDCARG